MIISLYPKPTKCYGDTVIRRAEKCGESVGKVWRKLHRRLHRYCNCHQLCH